MSDYKDDLATQLVQIQQCVRKKIDRYPSAKAVAPDMKEMLVKQVADELCAYLIRKSLRSMKRDVRGRKLDFPMPILLGKLDRLFMSAGLALGRQRRSRVSGAGSAAGGGVKAGPGGGGNRGLSAERCKPPHAGGGEPYRLPAGFCGRKQTAYKVLLARRNDATPT